jgi:hypothetical protein
LAHHPAVYDLSEDDNFVTGMEREFVRTAKIIAHCADDLLTVRLPTARLAT